MRGFIGSQKQIITSNIIQSYRNNNDRRFDINGWSIDNDKYQL